MMSTTHEKSSLNQQKTKRHENKKHQLQFKFVTHQPNVRNQQYDHKPPQSCARIVHIFESENSQLLEL